MNVHSVYGLVMIRASPPATILRAEMLRIKKHEELGLPASLASLGRLAYNLWWSWNRPARRLFRSVDPEGWARCRNPVALLRGASRARLASLACDETFLAELGRVDCALSGYLDEPDTWFHRNAAPGAGASIAYLSSEYGLHECVPIYCGGLGILSGDHMKAASDLGLPLTGFGLLYRHGYFDQRLNRLGQQVEDYPRNDFSEMPLVLVADCDGDPAILRVPIGNRWVSAEMWTAHVGRNRTFLLNSDLREGAEEKDARICGQLYGPDRRNRIEQELLLGIGAVEAAEKLGMDPDVWHMNEGHSAFQAMERIFRLIEGGADEGEALERVRGTTVFTTHTPVPAGNESFAMGLVREMLGPRSEAAGADLEAMLALGRDGGEFSLTAFALRVSRSANGVSQLHGQVSRRMWDHLDGGPPIAPIGAVTNGVHTRTWMAPEVGDLLADLMGPDWDTRLVEGDMTQALGDLQAADLWKVHRQLKERLVTYVEERERARRSREGIDVPPIALDPNALTIGFARRFAPYKRATLILRDRDRLERILADEQRPVQFIFAGKAYPTDDAGKSLVEEIAAAAADPAFGGRIAFLENYDMEIGRRLVQGVDVWLNTPRRPREASGTSGQKVPLNGGLNFSVLDGWWCEGYDGSNGWSIGHGSVDADPNREDAADAADFYRCLEEEVLPLYYRQVDGIPGDWSDRMVDSLRSVIGRFSAARMVSEYSRDYYGSAPATTSNPSS